MKCSEMRALLIAYVYDDILEKDKTLMEKHLMRCTKCRVELQKLKDTQFNCNYWQEQPVNKNLLYDSLLKTKPEIMTPGELAIYLRVTRNDIMSNLEYIPHFTIGKSIRFRRETIHNWIKQLEHISYADKSKSRLVWQSPLNRIFDISKS